MLKILIVSLLLATCRSVHPTDVEEVVYCVEWKQSQDRCFDACEREMGTVCQHDMNVEPMGPGRCLCTCEDGHAARQIEAKR